VRNITESTFFNLASYDHSMSGTIQARQGEQGYVLQRSEKLSLVHFFYNIEQTERKGQAPGLVRPASVTPSVRLR
jgi:hypothetical protein